jgi:hypothetical protein
MLCSARRLTAPFLFIALVFAATVAVACSAADGSPPPAGTGGSGVSVATVEPTVPVPPGPTATPTANSASVPDRPTTGKWIDVDVTRLQVQLMDGDKVLTTIGPIAVGVEINTGEYESTQTGLFHVYEKRQELAYDPPYDTYISDWVGFDPALANGFHSFLKDKNGNVVNPTTGRISNGCIRSGDSTVIFAYAQIGMPVLVHL